MSRSMVGRMVVATTQALAFASVMVVPVAANGPTIALEPSGPLPAGTSTVTITGAGFDPTANNGNGVYVVFGPITPAPGYYTDPGLYSAFRWVGPGNPDSAATAPMAADGSFTVTLDVSSVSTGSSGDVDCSVDACAVITFGAHGSTDRASDTCTAVSFASAGASSSASPDPGTSPLAAGSVDPSPPDVDVSAMPTGAPVEDPCSLLLATP